MALLRVSKGHLVPPPLKGLVLGSGGMQGPSPTPMGSDTPWSILGPTTRQSEAGLGGIPMPMGITTISTNTSALWLLAGFGARPYDASMQKHYL